MTGLAERRATTRFVPGQPDMWAFVLFETLVFTAYFGFYLFHRARNPELFLHSQAHLDLRIGVFNTLVLLLSSWSVARCVQSARAGVYRAALRDVYITAAFAAVFLFFKVFEWPGWCAPETGWTATTSSPTTSFSPASTSCIC